VKLSNEISISDITQVFSLIAVFISLIAVARSNKKLSSSLRLSTLQAMVTEMNKLRQSRAENPELERSLFTSRSDWSDTEIQHHLAAVQLANIFEWAFLARRDGLIELDVWDSWVETWRSVILSSDSLKASFTDPIWTFGRSPEIALQLTALVSGKEVITDPFKSPTKGRDK